MSDGVPSYEVPLWAFTSAVGTVVGFALGYLAGR